MRVLASIGGTLEAREYDSVREAIFSRDVEEFITEDGTKYNVNKRSFETAWMSETVFNDMWQEKWKGGSIQDSSGSYEEIQIELEGF
jgi:MoaA/NifB/PqqE/SkfB family radical SAM enzyme